VIADASGGVDQFTWASSFHDRYIRQVYDPSLPTPTTWRYVFQIYADNPSGADLSNDCWHALLYNFSTGAWDQLYSSCGVTKLASSVGADGWTMWESLGLMNACPSLLPITETYTFVRVNGQYVDPTRVHYPARKGNCWNSGYYRMESGLTPPDEWGQLYGFHWISRTP
jgi:hypothetical protein